MIVRVDGSALSCSRYLVREPLQGPWSAEVVCALSGGPPAVGDACTIDDGRGTTWAGTVTAASAGEGGTIAALSIVAGAARGEQTTTPRHWAGTVDAADVLAALAGDVGERASGPGPSLAAWRARGGSLAAEARTLATWSAGRWYVDASGAHRIDPLSWSPVERPGAIGPREGRGQSYECDRLAALTGRQLDGTRIGLTLYESRPGMRPRAVVYAADETDPRPRAGAILGATVDSQSDGRVDLTLDDGTAAASVPLWSAPGVRAIVPGGTRVLVADLGGDPRAMFAMLAPWESSPDSMTIGPDAADITIGGPLTAISMGLALAPPVRELVDAVLIPGVGPVLKGEPFVLQFVAPPAASKVKL